MPRKRPRAKRDRFGGAGPPGGGPRLDQLERLDEHRWLIPSDYKPGMHVPGLIFSSEELLPNLVADKALEQVANVACLPGIVQHSLAMPDIHLGLRIPGRWRRRHGRRQRRDPRPAASGSTSTAASA